MLFRRSLPPCAMFTWIVLGCSARAAEEAKPVLPLSRVVMFTSGIGYFEHSGSVEGDQQVQLPFNVGDVNDVLKSIVLEDGGGGKISAVTYAAKDPLSRTLRTFAIDLTREPTLADLLRQVRGEKIEVETRESGQGQRLVGSIVGIERRTMPGPKETFLPLDVLNLSSESGLRSVTMDSIVSIRLVDQELNADLQEALATLAKAHATDQKTVTLDFRGKAKRRVRVGYVLESPLWKTTYRLVLDSDGAPLLQGWAIVENTTEHDWDRVSMALVSGRPISFQMNLYQPFYVARPMLSPETYATVNSQTHGQDLAEQEALLRQQAALGAHMAGQKPVRSTIATLPSGLGGGMGGMGGGMGGGGFFGGPMTLAAKGEPINPAQGVATAATADDVGELFRYSIDEPVTLPRNQSAMLPIVNETITGERLSLYNPATHSKHPLNAVKLKNTTTLHLMQGPITVFDGGEYAGDARIEDVAPGAERLVSYALDLDVEVAPETRPSVEELVAVKVAKGTVVTTRLERREQRYRVKNASTKPRRVLIEQAVQRDWRLAKPEKPAEQTSDRYRFAVEAAPGKTAVLAVEEQHEVVAQQELVAVDSNLLGVYLRSKQVSQRVKDAIAEFQQRSTAISEVADRRSGLLKELATIDTEQGRLRENLKALDRSRDLTLYVRYIRKFEQQEDQIESLRAKTQALTDEEHKLRAELADFVAALDLQ
ncbi:MAG TPA: hypothetical protein VHZ24_20240 [Pirellulales bacterium]|nr:hypothetical protein [Pirellulales bacterium]